MRQPERGQRQTVMRRVRPELIVIALLVASMARADRSGVSSVYSVVGK
jgi:hypothetical protein